MKEISKTSNGSSANPRGSSITRVIIRPLASILVSLIYRFKRDKISPSTISLFALAISLSGNLFILLHAKNSILVADILIWFAVQQVAFTFDCVDGQYARRTHQSSLTGGAIDVICDLIGDIATFWTLIVIGISNLVPLSSILLCVIYFTLRVVICTHYLLNIREVRESDAGNPIKKDKHKEKILRTTFLRLLEEFQDGTIHIGLATALLLTMTNISQPRRHEELLVLVLAVLPVGLLALVNLKNFINTLESNKPRA